MSMLIFLAPARRSAFIIARELVPRTRLSSMTTTCFPSTISVIGIIHRFISMRSLWLRLDKAEADLFCYTYPSRAPHQMEVQIHCAKPNAAGRAESGTGITRSASLIVNFFDKNCPMRFLAIQKGPIIQNLFLNGSRQEESGIGCNSPKPS